MMMIMMMMMMMSRRRRDDVDTHRRPRFCPIAKCFSLMCRKSEKKRLRVVYSQNKNNKHITHSHGRTRDKNTKKKEYNFK